MFGNIRWFSYRQNKKGDLETAKLFGLPEQKWYGEDKILYGDAKACPGPLSKKYKIGVIANQAAGTETRLAQHGIMQYIDMVVASAEESGSETKIKTCKVNI